MKNPFPNNKAPRQTIPPNGGGIIAEIVLRARLIGRLMLDRRVNIFLKLIPVASLAYWINPIDLPTPLDDIGVMWLGLTLFVELCPEQVVAEHLANLKRVVPGEWKDPGSGANADVVDAEFRKVPPDQEDTND